MGFIRGMPKTFNNFFEGSYWCAKRKAWVELKGVTFFCIYTKPLSPRFVDGIVERWLRRGSSFNATVALRPPPLAQRAQKLHGLTTTVG